MVVAGSVEVVEILKITTSTCFSNKKRKKTFPKTVILFEKLYYVSHPKPLRNFKSFLMKTTLTFCWIKREFWLINVLCCVVIDVNRSKNVTDLSLNSYCYNINVKGSKANCCTLFQEKHLSRVCFRPLCARDTKKVKKNPWKKQNFSVM